MQRLIILFTFILLAFSRSAHSNTRAQFNKLSTTLHALECRSYLKDLGLPELSPAERREVVEILNTFDFPKSAEFVLPSSDDDLAKIHRVVGRQAIFKYLKESEDRILSQIHTGQFDPRLKSYHRALQSTFYFRDKISKTLFLGELLYFLNRDTEVGKSILTGVCIYAACRSIPFLRSLYLWSLTGLSLAMRPPIDDSARLRSQTISSFLISEMAAGDGDSIIAHLDNTSSQEDLIFLHSKQLSDGQDVLIIISELQLGRRLQTASQLPASEN